MLARDCTSWVRSFGVFHTIDLGVHTLDRVQQPLVVSIRTQRRYNRRRAGPDAFLYQEMFVAAQRRMALLVAQYGVALEGKTTAAKQFLQRVESDGETVEQPQAPPSKKSELGKKLQRLIDAKTPDGDGGIWDEIDAARAAGEVPGSETKQ